MTEVHIANKPIQATNVTTFFLASSLTGSAVSILTSTKSFTYPIINNDTEEQQLYVLDMYINGLKSNVPVQTHSLQDNAEISSLPTHIGLHTMLSSDGLLVDSDFWFNDVTINTHLNDNTIVDSVTLYATEDIVTHQATALQSGSQLSVIIPSVPQLNVTQNRPLFLEIRTGNVTTTTSPVYIKPRDPLLSSCSISGTLFSTDNITSRSLAAQTNTVVLTLHSETWITDEHLLRPIILSMFLVETTYAASADWFTLERPDAMNVYSMHHVLQQAGINRISDNILVVTLGTTLSIQHPEHLYMHKHIPTDAIHGARINQVPLLTVPSVWLYPWPGKLTIITNALQSLSEKDFWTSEYVRITLSLENDKWQDVFLLTDLALHSLRKHICVHLTCVEPQWGHLLQPDTLLLTSDNHLLHVDIPGQSSFNFNIKSPIEVTADIPLCTTDGLVTRLSNQPLVNAPVLLITPVQSYVSLGKATVSETEVWSGDVTLGLILVNDELVSNVVELEQHIRTIFSAHFQPLWVQSIHIQSLSVSEFNIILPKANPDSYNINHEIYVVLSIPASHLRNGNTLISPAITFNPVQAIASIYNLDGMSTQKISDGCIFYVDLQYDAWKSIDAENPVPMNIVSRQHTTHAWNDIVKPSLIFTLTNSKMAVQIPAGLPYILQTSEVVDIFVNESATYNNKRMYVSNFTIQGSTHLEQAFHNQAGMLAQLQSNLKSIKKVLQNMKLNVSNIQPKQDISKDPHFNKYDTIFDRMHKLNSSKLSNPIRICKPAALNGIQTQLALAFCSNVVELLTSYNNVPNVPKHTFIAVLIPSIQAAQQRRMHTILLGKPIQVQVKIQGVPIAVDYTVYGSIHTVILSSTQVLTVSGSGIQTSVFKA